MKKLQIIGMLIGLTGMALAWIFFSWKLVLVLMIVLWGNNIEQKHRIAKYMKKYMDEANDNLTDYYVNGK